MAANCDIILVPRVLESQFIIDNHQFDPSLSYHDSPEFKDMAKQLEEQIKEMLLADPSLKSKNFKVKVMDFG